MGNTMTGIPAMGVSAGSHATRGVDRGQGGSKRTGRRLEGGTKSMNEQKNKKGHQLFWRAKK